MTARLCRKGLHDVSDPAARYQDGECKACKHEGDAHYQGWRNDWRNPPYLVGVQGIVRRCWASLRMAPRR